MSAKTLVATTLLVAALGSHAQAQPDLEPKNGRVTIAVFLKPNDYLKPISRAYLLPQYSESIPGNRVQMFLRCFMERDNVFGKTESDKREIWNKTPLNKLPLAEVANYGGRLLDYDAYDAARMTQADWQLWTFLRRDGFNTLLPDVQKMRALASVMKVRVRGEIAAGDHLAAIRTLKCMLGLGRTFESHPTLIGELVGVAISYIAIEAVEELIQQPGTPNLYWALMDLPAPFISLRLPTEGERMMLTSEIEPLMTASEATNAEIIKQIDRINELLVVRGRENNNLFDKSQAPGPYKSVLLKKINNSNEVSAARDRVVKFGCDALLVKKWSAPHVVLVDDILHCAIYRDEMAKYMNLPYWQVKDGLEKAVADINEKTREWPSLALVSPMFKVKLAQARLDQRIAYLQILEAIRLHAFQNGESLPATLAEIKLPLPVDPITGKAFEYSVVKGVATLHGENPQPGAEVMNRYYEILLSK
jgi:hypothetical protein